MSRVRLSLGRLRRREDGSATIEMVLVLPLLLMIFLSAFESGMFMTRQVMLERAVDQVVRNVRLGAYGPTLTMPQLRTEICNRATLITNCAAMLRVELRPVNTQTWNLPNNGVTCLNRDEPIQPALAFQPGAANEVMLVRVCVIQRAIFPGSELGLAIAADVQGGYGITAVSAFVNEP